MSVNTMKKTSSQQSYYLFQVRFVGLVEGAKVSTVNIEYSLYATILREHRDNDFRTREAATCNMSGKLFYIGNNDSLLLLPCCTTNASSIANMHTCHRTLEGT